jgi:hypothetical protein
MYSLYDFNDNVLTFELRSKLKIEKKKKWVQMLDLFSFAFLILSNNKSIIRLYALE